MAKRRKQGVITPEIREEAVRALRERTLSREELAEAFGVSLRSLHRWERDFEEEELSRAPSSEEKAELLRLRKQVEKLERENEILKKFRAFSERRKK
jgi:transposase